MGLSQQRLADHLGLKRGKVSGYFYKTQAKPGFHKILRDEFNLDIGRFLTIEMDETNYATFFVEKNDNLTTVSDPPGVYRRSDAIDFLLKAKSAENEVERNHLIDEAIIAFGELIDENSRLKDELVESLKKKA